MIFKQLTYYISFFLVGIALASCSSTEESDAVVSCEVSFDVGSITRASLTTSSNITAKPFAVYGDMLHRDLIAKNSRRTIVFNGAQVSHNGTNWVYTNSDKQYWFPYHEHSFVAIHPASVLSQSDANTNYAKSQLSFTYTLPANPDDATDILMATHRRYYSTLEEETSGIVSFRFAHMLSLINIELAFDDNVRSNDYYILMHNSELSGVKTKAEINIIPAERLSGKQTNGMVYDINTQNGVSPDYTIQFAEPVKVLNDKKYVTLLSALIMIPQDFADNTEAQISFSYSTKDDSSIQHIVLPLKDLKWNSGKNHTYRLLFDRTGLHPESATISPWDELSAGDINAR